MPPSSGRGSCRSSPSPGASRPGCIDLRLGHGPDEQQREGRCSRHRTTSSSRSGRIRRRQLVDVMPA
jgi:hypothetical protein